MQLLRIVCANNADPLISQLLLPEIRMTVSNLSQAIRFLADNQFLRDVELKPGQASENMIEVIDENFNHSTLGSVA